MQKQPFAPHYGSGQAIAPGAASAAVAVDPHAKNVAVANSGTTWFFVRIGVGTTPGVGVTAVLNTDMPIPPGHCVTLTKADGLDTLAYIGTAGASGFVISGEGFMF